MEEEENRGIINQRVDEGTSIPWKDKYRRIIRKGMLISAATESTESNILNKTVAKDKVLKHFCSGESIFDLFDLKTSEIEWILRKNHIWPTIAEICW